MVDAHDSKSCDRKVVGVRVSPEAYLGEMKKIRLIYRLLFFLSCVLILVFFSTTVSFLVKDKTLRRKKISSLIRFLSKKLMKTLSFKIKAEGLNNFQKDQNYLIVANHVGYSDITLLHSFIKNNCFITHYEWQEDSPFLNLIAKKAKVYFIERRNLKNIRTELKETADILKKGLHLVFFPEGTSTNGSRILPFHPLFFTTATRTKTPVLPVCINYKKINNEPVSIKNRDLVYWYDRKMSFMGHLLKFLQLKSIEVNINFLPPINSESKNSRSLAVESRESIQKHFIPLNSN